MFTWRNVWAVLCQPLGPLLCPFGVGFALIRVFPSLIVNRINTHYDCWPCRWLILVGLRFVLMEGRGILGGFGAFGQGFSLDWGR